MQRYQERRLVKQNEISFEWGPWMSSGGSQNSCLLWTQMWSTLKSDQMQNHQVGYSENHYFNWGAKQSMNRAWLSPAAVRYTLIYPALILCIWYEACRPPYCLCARATGRMIDVSHGSCCCKLLGKGNQWIVLGKLVWDKRSFKAWFRSYGLLSPFNGWRNQDTERWYEWSLATHGARIGGEFQGSPPAKLCIMQPRVQQRFSRGVRDKKQN